MFLRLAVIASVTFLCTLFGRYCHAQPTWEFRGLHTGLTRANLDSVVKASGSPWIPGGPSFDRKTGTESPTIMSAGRMRVSGVFCLDSFAVVLRYRDDRHAVCAFFTAITLDYADTILRGFRIDLDVEGTISTDTLVRLLIGEFSKELPAPDLAHTEDGSVDYSGEILNNVRTYARWEKDGVDIRLIDTRPSLALTVRRVDR